MSSLTASSQPHSLAGTHVVIVGGTSGMGLALAQRLWAQKVNLTLLARNQARLDQVTHDLSGIKTRQFDLTQVERFSEGLAALGPIDHLVITAGTAHLAPLTDYDVTALRRIFDERLLGPLMLIRQLLPNISPTGSLLLTSAQIASRPLGVGAPAAAAMGAVETLVAALALELGPIRVNAVAPGLVDTPLLDALMGAAKRETLNGVAQTLPARRIATAEDMAMIMQTVLESPILTGEIFHTDGGGRWI